MQIWYTTENMMQQDKRASFMHYVTIVHLKWPSIDIVPVLTEEVGPSVAVQQKKMQKVKSTRTDGSAS